MRTFVFLIPTIIALVIALVVVSQANGSPASPGFPNTCDLQMNPGYGICVEPA